MRVRVPKGYLTKNSKHPGRLNESFEYLDDALAEQAKCHGCGCDPNLAYITLHGVDDGDLKILYIWNDGLVIADDSEELRANLATACRQRAAGESVDDPAVD